jgi:hypothetical protein
MGTDFLGAEAALARNQTLRAHSSWRLTCIANGVWVRSFSERMRTPVGCAIASSRLLTEEAEK